MRPVLYNRQESGCLLKALHALSNSERPKPPRIYQASGLPT